MTTDDGYDHSKLCRRCQGRGLEPLSAWDKDPPFLWLGELVFATYCIACGIVIVILCLSLLTR